MAALPAPAALGTGSSQKLKGWSQEWVTGALTHLSPSAWYSAPTPHPLLLALPSVPALWTYLSSLTGLQGTQMP